MIIASKIAPSAASIGSPSEVPVPCVSEHLIRRRLSVASAPSARPVRLPIWRGRAGASTSGELRSKQADW